MKATFSLTLIVSQDLCALSNMPEEYSTYIGNNKKKVVFGKSPKMSTYLYAWCIGEFDFVQATTKNGVNLRVFSPPGRALQGIKLENYFKFMHRIKNHFFLIFSLFRYFCIGCWSQSLRFL